MTCNACALCGQSGNFPEERVTTFLMKANEKITEGTPEVHSDKSLTLLTFGAMDQWTNGPMEQWTN